MSETELEPESPDPDQEPVEVIEGDDSDLEGEPDQEPDEGEHEPATLDVLEARDKEWERVGRYLAKNLGEIEGDDAERYVECPACRAFGTPGFVIPGPPPIEIVPVLHQWLGMKAPDALRADKASRMCDSCNGEGVVSTGSKVVGQTELPCLDCNGRGWIAVGDERRSAGLAAANGPAAPVPPPAETSFVPVYADDPPEVAQLRAQGYVIVPPIAPAV